MIYIEISESFVNPRSEQSAVTKKDVEADGKESTQSAREVFITKKGIEGDKWASEWQTAICMPSIA